MNSRTKEGRTQCPVCGREVGSQWHYCPTCGKQLPMEDSGAEAEGYAHIIRGLISYHERMTMGEVPERDFYLDALRFALECVEEKIER